MDVLEHAVGQNIICPKLEFFKKVAFHRFCDGIKKNNTTISLERHKECHKEFIYG